MTKPNIPALKRVEALLRKPVPKGVAFDLSNWRVRADCGTVACACGLAGVDPWFNERGFGLSHESYGFPVYHNEWGFGAVEFFFRINEEQAQNLFHSRAYRKPQRTNPISVANRLAKFIEAHS